VTSRPGPPAAARPSARRTRVALVLVDAGTPHGTSHAAHELIRRGAERHEFVVVSSRLAEEVRPLARWLRVPLPAGPFRLRWLVFYALAGLRLAGTRVDLVHALAPAPLVPNRVDLGTVLFSQVDFHAVAGPPRGLVDRGARAFTAWLERRAYRPGRVRMLSALAPAGRRALERHHPGLPVIVTPHIVDCERFRPDARSRAEVRRRLGVADDGLVALFVNNHYWGLKGLAVAIRGFAQAARAAPALRELWVVGAGPTPHYREVAAAHGLGDRVRFFGFVPAADIEGMYRGADVLVHPSQYDTFSLAVHEAAASGTPVVATGVHGVDDLLADGQAGVLVERSDAAVAAALVRLAGDPVLREGMGRVGRQRAQAFGPGGFTGAVLAAYEELLARPPAPP